MSSIQTFTIEYIWLDGNSNFRSKVRIVQVPYNEINIQLRKEWSYDGSSTFQAETANSEVILVPARSYQDCGKPNTFYLLCDSYIEDASGVRVALGARKELADLFAQKRVADLDVWFGFEQEFFIYDRLRGHMLGYTDGIPEQGNYYCNVQAVPNYNYSESNGRGVDRTRYLTEEIVKQCLAIGLGLSGWNLEVAPGQTEIQVFGHGIRVCDDLMMMRYITHRVLAEHGMTPIFDPKPLGPGWNGSGMHTNISTVATRREGGMEIIRNYLEKFENRHADHMRGYGEGNEERLTGIHETSAFDRFTWGIANRSTSVRIPRETAVAGRGYFEDRRPSANANPYIVAKHILKTIVE
jgi:glutamine synthetase